MKNKINSCVAQLNTILKGKGGDTLNFKIHFVSEGDIFNVPAHIDTEYLRRRSNSHKYSLFAGCGTIIHELLHLTGLVDEYDGKYDGYPFRFTGPEESIMYSSRNGFKVMEENIDSTNHIGIFPGHIRKILFPACLQKNYNYLKCAKYSYIETKDELYSSYEDDSFFCSEHDWLK